MKVVVIGGSGATGEKLVEDLLKNDWVTDVTVLLRKEFFPSHPKLNQVIVNFDKLDEYTDYINGDVAFSCLGTTLKSAGSKQSQWEVDYGYQLKFAELSSKNGISIFVLLSAKGANPDSPFFYSKMKGKLEESIKKLNFDKLIIFRPSLLIRPKSDRKMENLAVSLVKGMNKLGVLKNNTPIEVTKLAQAMINSINIFKSEQTVVNLNQIKKLAYRV